MGSTNPTDIGRIGHRFQVRVEHVTTGRVLVASRVQRVDPNINQQTEVYHELGTIDPVGYASEAPEMRHMIEEFVHDCSLDLLLAGKAANATSWNLGDYIADRKINYYILNRNNAGTVQGEHKFTQAVVAEAQWSWQLGQPITARYTLNSTKGGFLQPGHEDHGAWGVQDTTSPGAIKPKDARLFLATTSGTMAYRLQSFTLRVQWPTTVVREIGNRNVVGYLQEPPTSSLDIDIAAADHQPDDLLFYDNTSEYYYDYSSPNLLAASAIRVYDPNLPEAQTVLRSWALENLVVQNSNPLTAQVRGMATKRYSLQIPKATTAGSGGIVMYPGDLPA